MMNELKRTGEKTDDEDQESRNRRVSVSVKIILMVSNGREGSHYRQPIRLIHNVIHIDEALIIWTKMMLGRK